MTTVVLGAGAVGTATAWYLRKSGHEVVLLDRQPGAAMETSWGNGGVIHASEVEPWSQPGMPMKIIKWLGQENAPLLLRYGAIPHILRWGIEFARNSTPERFRENSKANLHLALHSLKSLQEIGAETGIAYDRATRGVLKIYRSGRRRAPAGFLAQHASGSRPLRRAGTAWRARNNTLAAPPFPPARSRRSQQFTQALAAAGRAALAPARRDGPERRASGGRVSLTIAGRSRPIPSWSPGAVSPTAGQNGIRVTIYPVKGISITRAAG
jgi:D-amino-acid dehydrogenase